MENSSNNTIDLRRLFNLCRKHLKFLITCTIALALAGFIVSKFIMTPKYTATTQLLVNQKNENNANGQAYTNQQADIQVINTYKDIITSPVILKETKKELANPVKVIRKAQPAKYKTLADGTKRLVSAAKPAGIHWSRLQHDDQPAVRRDHDQDADQLAGFLRQRGNRQS